MHAHMQPRIWIERQGWAHGRHACMTVSYEDSAMYDVPVQSGCIFLDRDGRHFHDILNFLRVLVCPCVDTEELSRMAQL